MLWKLCEVASKAFGHQIRRQDHRLVLELFGHKQCVNMSCLSYQVRKQSVSATLMSVFDYGDIVYMNASVSSLGMLDAVYHGALRFIITDIKFSTHRTRW